MNTKNSKKDNLTVRDFREDLGLTRFDVRLKTGITERSLADIEAGRSIPKLTNLLALTRLYDKSLKEMISALGIDVSDIRDDISLKH
ncbi:putative transcriptional regulator with C-terminal CBS domains [Xenococcus sp. PCC 7305]|uniref:helix-turn-helix domain-containing protein n=1 Tax=Xenococcus sp. PCC 7305 TaxID=102125 RepID=UPI0002AC37FD|nr:helix-turn-helix transcriptional regulator [Xenococcus sp. PCC 7305]ELS04822.1 putative transcriptional regulator with C-terminal CBS domains [Xenococcus sp. PCC 7305]